jgi:hypothetical protein
VNKTEPVEVEVDRELADCKLDPERLTVLAEVHVELYWSLRLPVIVNVK